MAYTRRRVMTKMGTAGQVSAATSRRSAPNPRKAKALKKVGQILTAFPEKVGQVSAETLSQVDTSADKSGQLGITVHNAMPGALAKEAQKFEGQAVGRKKRNAGHR